MRHARPGEQGDVTPADHGESGAGTARRGRLLVPRLRFPGRAEDRVEERGPAVHLDVTEEESWNAAIAATEDRFGPLSILVGNAGVQNPAAPVEATDRRVRDRVLAVNLTGTFLGIKAAAPSLRRGGGGAIVNIASTSGMVGTALYAPYTAGKWAVRGLTKTAALELGRDGIRVNAIHPGAIATPFITEPAAGSDTPISDFYSAEPFAIPRLGEPADITRALLFLTSDDASFATGAEFVIDGGLLLGPALRHADAA
ncbi:SDR family NAD(P)-dependent oxidoreductase [Streptomyces omiyaensis]|uniref:SDR family NAD(P)-dependent oxidoreductase n=1 Tax=Streptomyces omiyaensis TaxID=68247 RepID=UPI0036F9E50A